jgi:hypothetical protein
MDTSSVKIAVGGSSSKLVRVFNNDDVAHSYTLSADPSNDQGVVNVIFRGLDTEGSSVQFDVAAGEELTLDAEFTAALCYATCQESVKILLVNEDTGARFTETVPVTIVQNKQGFAAPGIKTPQLLALLLLAGAVVFKLNR